MKKLFISLGLAAIMLAPSCTTEPDEFYTPANGATGADEIVTESAVAYINVGIDNSNTDVRISLGEESENNVPLYWSKGDQLVINHTITTDPLAEKFDGKEYGSFGLQQEPTYPITLMYPASVAVEGDAEKFYIPTEQAYLQSHLSNGYGILKGQAATAEDNIKLKHLCGYVKVSLTGSATVKKVMLRTVGHEAISGYFKHNDTETETGMTTYMAEGFADGYYSSPVIAIDCGENGVTLSSEATDFYFALPAGTYSKGFVVYILDSSNKQQSAKAYGTGTTIVAGSLLKMPALAVNCTKDWGIYDGNEFAGFCRTLDKNAWLGVGEDTIHLRGDADMANESFSDIPQDSDHRGTISFPTDVGQSDKIKVIDGKKSETENYAILNLKKTTKANGSLLFATIPEHLTVQNLTLGKVVDDPTTEEIEADCVLTYKMNGSSSNFYNGVFAYIVRGSLINCVNKATVNGSSTSSSGLRTGIFSGNATTDTGKSIGTIKNCINYGSMLIDAANTKNNYIGGIVGYNYGTITGCSNYGAIVVKNAAGVNTNISGIAAVSATLLTECHNYGNISAINPSVEGIRIGGICGYYDYEHASGEKSFQNCTNGVEGSTTSGVITVSDAAISDACSIGGIVGCNKMSYMYNATNYAPINVNGTGLCYAGGIVGYTTKGVNTCKNYGALSASGWDKGWSYFGGVGGGASGGSAVAKASGSENYGNITIDCTAKSRVGGMAGYVKTMESNCKVKCNITINNAGTDSNVGGITGYTNNNTKEGFDCDVTITNKVNDATVRIGGVAGQMNGNTLKNCTLKLNLKNEGSGNATFGLITTGAAGLNKIDDNTSIPYVLTLGASGAPVKISKESSFLGMSITDVASILDRPAEGQSNPYLINDANSAATLTLARTNLVVE